MEISNKLLTISIPTWNRDYLLNELLQKLTYDINTFKLGNEVEILISNNGSTDNSDEVCRKFKNEFNYITYFKNSINIGARANVLQSMQFASSKYVIFLGDDDRLSQHALHDIINFLKSNSDIGLLLDISKSKLSKTEKCSKVDLPYLLENYFWYIGNAGLFVLKTSYVKTCLSKHTFEYFNGSWPQTQVQILGLFNNPTDEIFLKNMNLVAEAVHDQVMIYNSYYLWRTCHLDLYESIKSIKSELNLQIYKSALKNLNSNIMQVFFNILQCGVFVDKPSLRRKTALDIFKNLFKFNLKSILLLVTAALTLVLPSVISRSFSNIAIYFLKGKTGLNKKNEFVLNEKLKIIKLQNQKSNYIRTFEFDPSKA